MLRTILLTVVLLWSFGGIIEDIFRIPSGLANAKDYVLGMWPPDIEILQSLVGPLTETVQMAIAGTALAVIFAVPISILGARNISPHLSVYLQSRVLMSILRAVPDLVWAILFVSMVGLGPLAGVFAITLHCTGTLGKYFSEAIESIGQETIDVLEAMRVDGATDLQTIVYGIVPAVTPLFLSYILYHLESNIRAATVLGLVGAGGIGLYLTQAIRMFKRQQSLTIILVILVAVFATDFGSRLIRRSFLNE